ncbi:hypothetical protein ACUOAQ_12525, partial [Escherichia sp. SP-MK]
ETAKARVSAASETFNTDFIAFPFFYPRDDPLRDIHIYEKIVPVLQLLDFSRCGKNVMHDL